jgi:hypothetical protein
MIRVGVRGFILGKGKWGFDVHIQQVLPDLVFQIEEDDVLGVGREDDDLA